VRGCYGGEDAENFRVIRADRDRETERRPRAHARAHAAMPRGSGGNDRAIFPAFQADAGARARIATRARRDRRNERDKSTGLHERIACRSFAQRRVLL